MRQTALWFSVLVAASGCRPLELKVTMNSDNNSGQSGFAVISDRGNSVTVVIETSAPDFEGPQNVHLHTGNCGEVDPIAAPLENLVALADKPGRVGSTSPEVKKRAGGLLQFEELLEGEWLINVHDACEYSIYVSCGELQRRAPK